MLNTSEYRIQSSSQPRGLISHGQSPLNVGMSKPVISTYSRDNSPTIAKNMRYPGSAIKQNLVKSSYIINNTVAEKSGIRHQAISPIRSSVDVQKIQKDSIRLRQESHIQKNPVNIRQNSGRNQQQLTTSQRQLDSSQHRQLKEEIINKQANPHGFDRNASPNVSQNLSIKSRTSSIHRLGTIVQGSGSITPNGIQGMNPLQTGILGINSHQRLDSSSRNQFENLNHTDIELGKSVEKEGTYHEQEKRLKEIKNENDAQRQKVHPHEGEGNKQKSLMNENLSLKQHLTKMGLNSEKLQKNYNFQEDNTRLKEELSEKIRVIEELKAQISRLEEDNKMLKQKEAEFNGNNEILTNDNKKLFADNKNFIAGLNDLKREGEILRNELQQAKGKSAELAQSNAEMDKRISYLSRVENDLRSSKTDYDKQQRDSQNHQQKSQQLENEVRDMKNNTEMSLRSSNQLRFDYDKLAKDFGITKGKYDGLDRDFNALMIERNNLMNERNILAQEKNILANDCNKFVSELNGLKNEQQRANSYLSEITQLRASLDTANLDMKRVWDDKARADHEKANLVNELAKKDHERGNLTNELAKKDHEKAGLANEQARKEQEKVNLTNELTKKDHEKAGLANELARKEQEKVNLTNELARRDQEKVNLASELARRDQEKVNIASELSQSNEQVRKMSIESSRRPSEIHYHHVDEIQLKALENDITNLKQNLLEKDKELTLVKNRPAEIKIERQIIKEKDNEEINRLIEIIKQLESHNSINTKKILEFESTKLGVPSLVGSQNWGSGVVQPYFISQGPLQPSNEIVRGTDHEPYEVIRVSDETQYPGNESVRGVSQFYGNAVRVGGGGITQSPVYIQGYSELQKLQNENTVMQKQLTAITGEFEFLKTQTGEIRYQRDDNEINALRNEITGLNHDISNLKVALENKGTKVEMGPILSVGATLDKLVIGRTDATPNNMQRNLETTSVQEQLSALKNEIERLRGQNKPADQNLHEAVSQLKLENNLLKAFYNEVEPHIEKDPNFAHLYANNGILCLQNRSFLNPDNFNTSLGTRQELGSGISGSSRHEYKFSGFNTTEPILVNEGGQIGVTHLSPIRHEHQASIGEDIPIIVGGNSLMDQPSKQNKRIMALAHESSQEAHQQDSPYDILNDGLTRYNTREQTDFLPRLRDAYLTIILQRDEELQQLRNMLQNQERESENPDTDMPIIKRRELELIDEKTDNGKQKDDLHTLINFRSSSSNIDELQKNFTDLKRENETLRDNMLVLENRLMINIEQYKNDQKEWQKKTQMEGDIEHEGMNNIRNENDHQKNVLKVFETENINRKDHIHYLEQDRENLFADLELLRDKLKNYEQLESVQKDFEMNLRKGSEKQEPYDHENQMKLDDSEVQEIYERDVQILPQQPHKNIDIPITAPAHEKNYTPGSFKKHEDIPINSIPDEMLNYYSDMVIDKPSNEIALELSRLAILNSQLQEQNYMLCSDYDKALEAYRIQSRSEQKIKQIEAKIDQSNLVETPVKGKSPNKGYIKMSDMKSRFMEQEAMESNRLENEFTEMQRDKEELLMMLKDKIGDEELADILKNEIDKMSHQLEQKDNIAKHLQNQIKDMGNYIYTNKLEDQQQSQQQIMNNNQEFWLVENAKLKERIVDLERQRDQNIENHKLNMKTLEIEFDKKFKDIQIDFEEKTHQLAETNDSLQREIYILRKQKETDMPENQQEISNITDPTNYQSDQVRILYQENEKLNSKLEAERNKGNTEVIASRHILDDNYRNMDILINERDHYHEQFSDRDKEANNLKKDLISEQEKIARQLHEVRLKEEKIIKLEKRDLESIKELKAAGGFVTEEADSDYFSGHQSVIKAKEENILLVERLEDLRLENEELKNRVSFQESEQKYAEKSLRYLEQLDPIKTVENVTKPYEEMKYKSGEVEYWKGKYEESQKETRKLKDDIYNLQKTGLSVEYSDIVKPELSNLEPQDTPRQNKPAQDKSPIKNQETQMKIFEAQIQQLSLEKDEADRKVFLLEADKKNLDAQSLERLNQLEQMKVFL